MVGQDDKNSELKMNHRKTQNAETVIQIHKKNCKLFYNFIMSVTENYAVKNRPGIFYMIFL